MSVKQLNADELGEKGEARFREICADAKIICNPSSRDRTGWDFLVEFPFTEPTIDETFDKRTSPISCHFQVKTVWTSSGRIKLRLSSAERLAKEPKPSFIYVFEVNNDLAFVDAYLIHVLDENLSKVLKRLRTEQAKFATKINEKTITFDVAKSGRKIPPTGPGLLGGIKDCVSSGLNEYITTKKAQLSSLGFELRRYQGKVKMRVGSHEEMVDAFLGLQEIEVSDFEMFEIRFGIKLPAHQEKFTAGKMKISPNAVDTCNITVSDVLPIKPATFLGEMFLPAIPGLPLNQMKFLIRSPFLQLGVSQRDGAVQVTFQLNDLTESFRCLAEWITYLRLMLIFSRGTGSITLRPSRTNNFPVPIPVPVSAELGLEKPEVYQFLLKGFEAALHICDSAGVADRPVSFDQIESRIVDILAVDGLLGENAGMVSNLAFTIDAKTEIELPPKAEVLFINFISFASVTFGYYGLAGMAISKEKNNQVRWVAESFKMIEVSELVGFPMGYDAFIAQAKKTPAQALIVNDLGDTVRA